MKGLSVTVNNSTFDKDLSLEHKFDMQIKAILGMVFITKDIEMDLKQGTDFLICTVSPFKCAVRLRRYPGVNKYEQYKNEFTIRWSRPSGVDTEIDKILQGLVDYILYGFLNEQEEKIMRWFVGDLKIFRKHYQQPKYVLPNKPFDSELAVFHLSQFPKDFIIRHRMPEARRKGMVCR